VLAFAEELQRAGVDCTYESVESSHGHDSFLAEPDKLVGLLKEFLEEDDSKASVRGVRTDDSRLGEIDGSVA